MQQQRHVISFLLLLLGALVLVSGCSDETPNIKKDASLPPLTGVRIEDVALQEVPETLDAVGTVQSVRHTPLSARLMAHVTAIHVQVGESVHTGQPLLELDARETQSQLRQAQAGLAESRAALVEVEQSLQAARQAREVARAQQELATATLHRYRALLERGSMAPQEYDEVAMRAKVAGAETQRAEAMLSALMAKKRQVRAKVTQAEAEATSMSVLASYATITAPFDGIVVAIPAEVGMLASPSVPLLEVEEPHYLLAVAVEESATSHLRVGQKTHVTVAASTQFSTQPILEIVPTADPASRTVLVKIALANIPGLRSGLYGKAEFTVGRRTAIQVPQEAIVTRGQLQGLFVLAPHDTARLRFVKIGKISAGMVEILAGLAAGERVIVPNGEQIVDGRRILWRQVGANAG